MSGVRSTVAPSRTLALPPSASRGPATTVAERAARVRFRRAMALMALTLVAPGAAQLLCGNERVGRAALRVWSATVAVGLLCLAVAVVHHPFAFWLASDLLVLWWLRLFLLVAAIGWAALFLDAWRLGRPLTLGLAHRRAVVGVNGLLCFGVAGALLFGAHVVGVQRDFLISVFGDGAATGAHDGRYNVLLVGGDSGASRWGMRTDSMTVASIDAETGRTVLVSLPRSMQNFPFREGSVMDGQFPDGFDCDECYLNGVSTWVGDHRDLFPDSETPGIDATISAVEGITDLSINYWAMVNLEGFKDLVDAVGGVTLDVKEAIPVGGLGDDVTGYIEPGVRELNGYETLWYARAREGSDDYSRMARQKCVMNAMLEQISPEKALTNFEDLAAAGSELFSTDMPASEVDRFIDLALKARGQKVSTLSLVPPIVNTVHPDIADVQDRVAAAIDQAEGTGSAPEGKRKKKQPTTITGGSEGSYAEGYAANESEDLDASC